MQVNIADITVMIDRAPIVSKVTIEVAPGSVVGLIGPNGAGKSTVLRCVYRALKPTAGAVLLGGEDVRALGSKRVGQRVAVVAQDHSLDNEYSVYETVAMGRTPHKRLLDRDGAVDLDLIDHALDRVRMGWARNRLFTTLSGGERQRVLVARAIAQQTPALLLDEPTNHLDIGAQLELMTLLTDLRLTTVAAMHDLDHASAYCDQVVLLSHGQVIATGEPAAVLTPERVYEIFGVRSVIIANPLTGRPHFLAAASWPG